MQHGAGAVSQAVADTQTLKPKTEMEDGRVGQDPLGCPHLGLPPLCGVLGPLATLLPLLAGCSGCGPHLVVPNAALSCPAVLILVAALMQVGRGSLVMDPFVGTGSCLVPAAHLGAYTIGTDIDVRVIKMGEWSAVLVAVGPAA